MRDSSFRLKRASVRNSSRTHFRFVVGDQQDFEYIIDF